MKLNLKRPLVIFDLETTGTNITHDRIVEIGYIKVFPDGREETKGMRLNPEMHIPEESTAVHHISDADVKDCPTFRQVAKNLANTFSGCDFAGFNSNHFDLPLLAEEFLRVGIDFDFSKPQFVDVQTIFHKKEPRTLSAAYKFYCDGEFDAHAASNDTQATYEVLKAQLDHYDDLENDIDFLAKFSSNNRNVDLAGRLIYNDKDEIVFNFGKYKGQPVADVLQRDPGYYGWIISSDFPLNTKQALTRISLAKDNSGPQPPKATVDIPKHSTSITSKL